MKLFLMMFLENMDKIDNNRSTGNFNKNKN